MISDTIQWISAEVLGAVAQNIAFVGPIVFALGFAESIVFLSLFVQSTILFLGIGGVHHAAGGSFLDVWLWGACGAFLGDILSYAAGRYFKNDVYNVWPFSSKPEWYQFARDFTQKWGLLGIIGSKFLGMMRPFVPVVAGAMVMPMPLFLLASAISSLVWAGAFLAPGYGLGMLMK